MKVGKGKSEFWETSFVKHKEMWGFEPAKSALIVNDFFVEKGINNILIPGFGYGRNAQVFKESGIQVTGIEISGMAIEMAEKHYGKDITIYHASVTEMPLNNEQYSGLFCYALIHLLNAPQRKKFIRDCYNQLAENGVMIFTTISKNAHTYGKGKFISNDRYEVFDGVKMYFYDEQSIRADFEKFGLFEVTLIDETYPFYIIKCKKATN